MESKRSVGRMLFEAASITLAVILGFAATEWGEQRRERATAHQALEAIERELQANLNAVSQAVPYYGSIAGALEAEIASNGDGPLDSSRIEEWRGLSPPLIRAASFDLAVSTGALEHIDFDVADMVSQTYEVQSNLVLAIDQALSAMVAGDLSAFSDWLRVTALLEELTGQSEYALREAVSALAGGGA